MSTVTIRPVTPADKAQWWALWTDYLTFYESTLPPEIYESTWSRFFDEGRYEPNCLVAEKDGALVGLVHFLQHRHNWKIENVIYLQDLYVSPAARGTRAGRALIEAVYAYGDQNNCPSIYWMTQEFNTNARLLYDRIATLTPFIKYQR